MKSRSLLALLPITTTVLLAACSSSTPAGSSGPRSVFGKGAPGDAVYAKACTNPITMTPAPGETTIDLDKATITGQSGAYVLSATELFYESVATDGSKDELHGIGLPEAPSADPQTTTTDASRARVVCETSAASDTETSSIKSSLDLPFAISAFDGTVKVYRKDEFSADAGKISTESTLYPNAQKVSAQRGALPDGMQVLTVQQPDGAVVMKVKYKKANADGSTSTIWFAGTYRFQPN